jgi:hypothetical protein
MYGLLFVEKPVFTSSLNNGVRIAGSPGRERLYIHSIFGSPAAAESGGTRRYREAPLETELLTDCSQESRIDVNS